MLHGHQSPFSTSAMKRIAYAMAGASVEIYLVGDSGRCDRVPAQQRFLLAGLRRRAVRALAASKCSAPASRAAILALHRLLRNKRRSVAAFCGLHCRLVAA